MAPRPPRHYAIPALADALSKDIDYSLPDNYMQGAGDTYFSGKMLAKLGRIIVIAQELRGLAESSDDDVPDTSTAEGKELKQPEKQIIFYEDMTADQRAQILHERTGISNAVGLEKLHQTQTGSG